ncbi:MAG: SDH family Clp fold serine proteinase, partial [Candidatus Dormibacteria bacterium]
SRRSSLNSMPPRSSALNTTRAGGPESPPRCAESGSEREADYIFTAVASTPSQVAGGPPPQTPLYHAENAARYERQALIDEYQRLFRCRLVVIYDLILPYALTVFEDLVCDADPAEDLHLLLATPGGDGEAALRLGRSAQARCNRLVLVVPDVAKSAGTIVALGAHQILMGPTSDLGPIDPQLVSNPGSQELISAKLVISAVESALASVQQSPETYPVHAALLANITAVMVEQARAAIDRTADLALDALMSNPERTEANARTLWDESLCKPLMVDTRSHEAVFGADAALAAGLPVVKVDPTSDQWRLIWRLWTKYFVLGQRIHEGIRASQVIGPWQPQQPSPT